MRISQSVHISVHSFLSEGREKCISGFASCRVKEGKRKCQMFAVSSINGKIKLTVRSFCHEGREKNAREGKNKCQGSRLREGK